MKMLVTTALVCFLVGMAHCYPCNDWEKQFLKPACKSNGGISTCDYVWNKDRFRIRWRGNNDQEYDPKIDYNLKCKGGKEKTLFRLGRTFYCQKGQKDLGDNVGALTKDLQMDKNSYDWQRAERNMKICYKGRT